jgi:outer membrane protein OmpA-like peptidoglycan-associated protein
MTGAITPTAIIVGAGIGGLSAAISLSRAGWRVSVFEQAETLVPMGAALSLWPNAIDALDSLGLHDALRAISEPVDEVAVAEPGGTRIAAFRVSQCLPGRTGLMVTRSDLQAILLAGLLVDRAVPATVTRSVASMIPPLLFEHDRTELSSCGEASLYDLLRSIDEAPSDVRVIVEGHADGTGDDAYNRALSTRRAEAVRDFLVAHGVAAERIELRTRGEGAPLVAETDERALSMNRRVVVHLERTSSPAATPMEASP